jgi:hypothetical protein
MKSVFFLVLLAGLALPGLAAAQEQKPEAIKPEAAKPAAKESRKKKSSTAAGKSKRQQDARHCLQRPTNSEIIKCAEAYL